MSTYSTSRKTASPHRNPPRAFRRLSLFTALLCVAAAALCSAALPGEAASIDRYELDKVLKTIPPNGPFSRYGNVRMRGRSRQAGMAPVIFRHWSHRARYTCRVCHQELGFSMRPGDTGITRAQNVAGKFCGACHDGGTAFSVKDGAAQCDRCHMKSPAQQDKDFAAFAEQLPMAPFGNGIDWSAALNSGLLAPRNTLKSDGDELAFPEKLRKPLKLGTASPSSDVRFSHEDHFAELDCSSCHPDLFSIKKEGTPSFSMDANIYGGFCGACHMHVAFPMNDCSRCHKR